MVDAATATTADATAQAAAASAAAAAAAAGAKPWYEGKADAETIGHWDNKGWKKDDPVAIALDATKAARELQKHFGVPADQLMKLPKDASDEAGWKGVYTRLGVPAEAKDYDLAGLKRADGSDVDAALADTLRNALFTGRAPKERALDAAKAVVKHLDDQAAARANERLAATKTERDTLLKDWGANYELNRLTAMQGAKRLGVAPETVAKLEGEIGYSKVMEMFRKIGKGTTEDTFTEGGQGGSPTTQNGARARLSELQSDPSWAAKVVSKTDGAAEKREFANLMQIINGEAA